MCIIVIIWIGICVLICVIRLMCKCIDMCMNFNGDMYKCTCVLIGYYINMYMWINLCNSIYSKSINICMRINVYVHIWI